MLSRTLNRFRRDLRKPDLPLMVGQMGQFTRWHDGQNRVNDAQEIVCKTTPNCHFVSSTGLAPCSDRLHFSTNGARELGIRYAIGCVDLLKKKSAPMKEDNRGTPFQISGVAEPDNFVDVEDSMTKVKPTELDVSVKLLPYEAVSYTHLTLPTIYSV